MAFTLPHLQRKPGWAVQSVVDPAFAKLGGLLSDPADLPKGGFAFLGIPFEGLTINPIGGRGGPDGVRTMLSTLRPYSPDLDIDFVETNGLSDLGDVDVEQLDYDATFARTEAIVTECLKRGWIPVISGGSHSVTEATLRAFSEFHGKNVGVVWFDGHPDIMDDYKGDKHYCGCPLMRLIEGGHVRPENVASFGLCGFANAAGEIRKGRDMGLHFYTMDEFYDKGLEQCIQEAVAKATDGTDAFYITFDVDGMDHTFAPATQYPRPGGFQPWEVMRFIRRLGMAGAGAMDVTEYAPLIDTTRNTGNILATLLCEFMAGKAHHMQNGG
ncbi:MAG: agmatinase family protein [Rhodospirillaceae bacterium]|jgi:agmatinase|nr:agmatinase family protein [Rhodospirillaceae bacterium]